MGESIAMLVLGTHTPKCGGLPPDTFDPLNLSETEDWDCWNCCGISAALTLIYARRILQVPPARSPILLRDFSSKGAEPRAEGVFDHINPHTQGLPTPFLLPFLLPLSTLPSWEWPSQ